MIINNNNNGTKGNVTPWLLVRIRTVHGPVNIKKMRKSRGKNNETFLLYTGAIHGERKKREQNVTKAHGYCLALV